MTDKGKNNQKQSVAGSQRAANETALMIEGLYNGIAFDLQKMKKELMNEFKYASMQSGAVYQSIQQEVDSACKTMQTGYDSSADALKKNFEEAFEAFKKDVDAATARMSEEAKKAAEENGKALNTVSTELKYGYQQNQMVFESLSNMMKEELVTKLDSIEGKTDVLAKIDEALAVVTEKTEEILAKCETNYDAIAETIKEKIIDALPVQEAIDYDKITDAVTEALMEKTEVTLAAKNKEVLDAVVALPTPENVDYVRVSEEVSDKVVEKLSENLKSEPAPEFDYDRIIYGTTEKVVESLPYPEKLDYTRIEEMITAAVSKAVAEQYDAIAEAVLSKMPTPTEPETVDYDAIAVLTAAKLPEPAAPEEIDYDKLSEMIASKIPAPAAPEAIDYDKLAELVAKKIAIPTPDAPTYELLVDESGAKAIADSVATALDYDGIAAKTAEKTFAMQAEKSEEFANVIAEKVPAPSYELLIDDEGANAIADAIAERLQVVPEAKEEEKEEVEEKVEEKVEEPETEEVKAEEPEAEPEKEEAKEEEKEEAKEEPAPVAVSEIAIAETLAFDDLDNPNELVDADTGLVLRLKKSFEAKLRQSAPEVKSYYSTVKNALACYKKLNSNMSWHGDRFNFGRDTVAKMTISGKTLCFYIALDPADPELKQTVYHQKDVGKQKAYESTPFMVKIKSETAAKRAARLIAYLAEKLGAVKKEDYETVDYVEEFAYASTKQLLDDGLIKVTKEKKVALNF